MLISAISSFEIDSRCIISPRRLLPCATTSTSMPARSCGTIVSYQYGQDAHDHVEQALRRRQDVRREACVARVVARVLRAVDVDGGGRHVEAAPPEVRLLRPWRSVVSFLSSPCSAP
jgi:plasmid stabilization system protein ParE